MSVQELPADRQERTEHHLTYPVVYRLEPIADGPQYLVSYEFFHGVRRLVLPETGGTLQELELDLAADHGGERSQGLPPLGEPFEPDHDQFAHPVGQSKRLSCRRRRRSLLQRPQGLDDHEGVAIAGTPDPLGELALDARGSPARSQELHQRCRVALRERPEDKPADARQTQEIAEHQRLGDILLARCQHDQDGPGGDPSRQDGD